jgi:hypothetical protein
VCEEEVGNKKTQKDVFDHHRDEIWKQKEAKELFCDRKVGLNKYLGQANKHT